MGYAVKAPLKHGVEVAMRTSNNANPIEDIVYNMHKASPKKHAGVYINWCGLQYLCS